MNPRKTPPFLCPSCGTRMPRGALHCEACAQPLYDDARIARARALCEKLIDEHGEDPYLRSAGLLTYSLRSRVRGFLGDTAHPFVAALVAHQRALLELGGDGASEQLLPHAERAWIEPRAPVLARALRTLREQWGERALRAGRSPSPPA